LFANKFAPKSSPLYKGCEASQKSSKVKNGHKAFAKTNKRINKKHKNKNHNKIPHKSGKGETNGDRTIKNNTKRGYYGTY